MVSPHFFLLSLEVVVADDDIHRFPNPRHRPREFLRRHHDLPAQLQQPGAARRGADAGELVAGDRVPHRQPGLLADALPHRVAYLGGAGDSVFGEEDGDSPADEAGPDEAELRCVEEVSADEPILAQVGFGIEEEFESGGGGGADGEAGDSDFGVDVEYRVLCPDVWIAYGLIVSIVMHCPVARSGAVMS